MKRKSKSREDMSLSLDLSSVQGTSAGGGEASSGLEPSYTRQKREKVAYYGSCCSEIRPWLYLGGNSVAANKEQLLENGITDVLNFSAVIHPNYHENDSTMRYHPYFLMDSQMEPISSLFYDVIDLIDSVKARKGKAFVHCHYVSPVQPHYIPR
jgi:protein-tyrosine phosphatase